MADRRTAAAQLRREVPRAVVLCEACDGTGSDGDILWPRHCEDCGGTGIEPDDWWDEDADYAEEDDACPEPESRSEDVG